MKLYFIWMQEIRIKSCRLFCGEWECHRTGTDKGVRAGRTVDIAFDKINAGTRESMQGIVFRIRCWMKQEILLRAILR